MKLIRIERNDPHYPGNLLKKLGGASPAWIDALGNLDILNNHKVALFCSRRCPAEKIIEAQELAHRLRDEGVTVISGFHSPVEKECLRILKKGTQPIIICPAKGLDGIRLPKDWQVALMASRLLFLSPFGKTLRRSTAESSIQRNEFVEALADRVLIIHAENRGSLASLPKAKKALQSRDRYDE